MMRLVNFTILLVFLFSFKSQSISADWEPTNGPYGGRISDLAMLENGNLIAVASSFTYVSKNQGQDWEILQDLEFIPRSVYSKNDGTVFFASILINDSENELYRTNTELNSWVKVTTGLEDRRILDLYFGPAGEIFACTDNGVYKSEDNGDNWSNVYIIQEATHYRVENMAFDSDGTVFLGTLSGLYRSTDNGTSFELLNNSTDDLHTNIENIVINDQDEIFITTPSGPYRSIDGGDNWDHLLNGINPSNVGSLVLGDADEIYIGMYWGGMHKSTDNGDNWTPIHESGGSSMILTDQGEIYAGSANGVLHSNSDFSNWDLLNKGIMEKGVNVVTINKSNSIHNGEVFAGDDSGCLHKSTDNGESWTLIKETNGAGISEIVFGPDASIYASVVWDGVYRSMDNGESWQQIIDGINDWDVRAITIDHDGHLYAGTFSEIYKSTNNGDTWSIILQQQQSVQCSSLVVDSRNYLYAGTVTYGVLRSTNGGVNWDQYTDGLNQPVVFLACNSSDELFACDIQGNLYNKTNELMPWANYQMGMGIWHVFNINVDEMLAGVDNMHQDIGVYRSTDGGHNWTSYNDGMNNNYAYDFDMNSDGIVYVASSSGVYKSTAPITDVEETVVSESGLSCYPNPAIDNMTISLEINRSGKIDLALYDILGNKLIDVYSGLEEPGSMSFNVKTDKLPQGTYYLKLLAGSKGHVKAINVVK